MKLESINPHSQQLVESYDVHTEDEVLQRIESAASAQQQWHRSDPAERSAKLRQLAELLRTQKNLLAQLITIEMGKLLKESMSEIEKCAWVCDYYAEEGPGFLEPEMISTDATRSYAAFQPLGVVLAVMPWNFPFWQVFRFAAPAMMAGNAGLLKHAGNVSGCALAIENLFREAGFPEGLFGTLLIPSKRVADVIAHRDVKAVTLTGSTPAGRAVASVAGQHLKKAVLELGGSDPYLILRDADLKTAAELCVKSRMINAGQSCIAAKRFIVEESIVEEFTGLMVERMGQLVPGDPISEQTTLAPMARADLRDELHEQVTRSVEAGADLRLGGTVPELEGAFYHPTVLAGVRPGMAAFDEELFGPVAAVIPAGDEAEAIALANQSAFGLGAAVFTSDVKRGEKIAAEGLEAGCCFVNDFVKSDPRLPFGGVKESGYGRELSHFGMREFMNVKTVSVR